MPTMRPTILRPLLRGCKPHFIPRHCKTTTPPPRTTTTILNHAATYSQSSSPFNPDTYLTAARRKLASQPPTLIPDHLSPTHSHLLTLSLADHVPALFPPPPSSSSSSSSPPSPPQAPALPQGHHLVYFPLQLPPSRLMPDGTDPGHCPGAPFVRRMWAGGEVVFREGWEAALKLDGRSVSCVERVGEPVLKEGRAGEVGGEKVFVEVTREYGAEGEGAVVEEIRRLVFMREREGKGAAQVAARVVRASATPEFTFTLTPDATLLFRFSALTYNAHAIHLDPDYARNREGYKGLLVHGPLSLVLMLSALRACLMQVLSSSSSSKGNKGQKVPYVKSLNYRNVAPLYAGEQMKVCLQRTKAEGDELGWDVWIEGPEGGLAVKGRAVTTGTA